MKEHHRTDRLIFITILFVLVIAVVLITYKAPRLNYTLEASEILTELNAGNYEIPADSVEDLLANEKIVFVDLRNSGDYFVNHIENAVNIPTIKILEDSSIDLFESDKTFVLYGKNHVDANGPWLLLKQLGYDNIRILVGGWNNYMHIGLQYPQYYADSKEVEKAEFDFNDELIKATEKFIELNKTSTFENNIKSLKIPAVKKTTPLVPLPVQQKQEAEEEGC